MLVSLGRRAQTVLALTALVVAGVGCEVVLGLNDAERAAPGGVTSPSVPDASSPGDSAAADATSADASPPDAGPQQYNDGQFVISSLQDFTCGLAPDQKAYCWGVNTYGQLGDGTIEQRNSPVRVAPQFSDVVSISAGYTHACLVRVNGDLYCWGKNDRGQLGDGTKDERHDPVGKLSMTGAVSVGVGGWHTCAITTLQGVRCWGDNYYGALGDGTFTARTSYVDVANLSQVVQIAVGPMHNCALTQQGKVYCWGRAVFDEVGYAVDPNNGSPDPGDFGSPNALEVQGLDNIVELAAGEDHTCATRGTDGAIFCWGRNDYAEYGDGFKDTAHLTPTRTVEGDGGVPPYARHITAGKFTTCGVFSGGLLRCWGENNYGQIGNGDTTPGPYFPSPSVNGLRDVIRVSTNEHTCAWRHDTTVSPPWKLVCFGRNDLGQLGIGYASDGGTPYELLPHEVAFPSTSPRNDP